MSVQRLPRMGWPAGICEISRRLLFIFYLCYCNRIVYFLFALTRSAVYRSRRTIKLLYDGQRICPLKILFLLLFENLHKINRHSRIIRKNGRFPRTPWARIDKSLDKAPRVGAGFTFFGFFLFFFHSISTFSPWLLSHISIPLP